MDAVFDVSVVVPTFNRRDYLAPLLNSLERQRLAPPFEVLVVDNNSDDDTRQVVESFQARRTLSLAYVFEPRRGVSHARNAGIALAKGAIVAFLDDDEEASVDWVATVKRTFDQHADIDCIGGPVRPRWPHDPPPWLTREHFGPVGLQDEAPWMRLNARKAARSLGSGNLACRSEALETVGGFDPAFVRNQDLEFNLRLWNAGREGLFTPELVVMTNVPRERMTKAYHRKWNATRGRSRAMMGYYDRFDREGRLVPENKGARRFLGTPLFLYRRLFAHLGKWLVTMLTRRSSGAFYHETRAREVAAYIAMRYQMEYHGATVQAHLAEVQRLVRYLVSPRFAETLPDGPR